jgi:plastocyanin
MKNKHLLLITLLLVSVEVFTQTATITASGFSFIPAEINVATGTTIEFNIGGTHNAVEVSQETWNANGSEPNGGFSVPFGGGNVVLDETGTYYYICEPHINFGMKGIIHVEIPSDLTDLKTEYEAFTVFPNPVGTTLYAAFTLIEAGYVTIEVVDLSGRILTSVSEYYFAGENVTTILTGFMEPGQYYITLRTHSETLTLPVIKM